MGRSLTNNLTLQYAIESALGSLAAAVAAQGVFTVTGNPADAAVVVIGASTYTWETSAIDTAGEVQVGADASASLDNLVAAINGGTGSGTTYGTGTGINASAYAYRSGPLSITVVARTAGTAGNSVASTTTVAGATWTGATLAGGAASAEGGIRSWKQLEPNDITGFGAQITTTARSPISPNRQRRKGTVTDLDSTAEFESDTTIDALEDFVEGFVMARAVHYDLLYRGCHVQNGAYQLQGADADIPATEATRLKNAAGVITLLKARGYANSANNGLKALATARVIHDSTLPVASLVAETAPSNAVVELAGLRTDDCTWTWNTPTGYATLTSAADVTDWTVFLTPGQFVHVGSTNGAGGVQNAFGAAQEIFGYARVRSIAGGSVIFDKVSDTLKTTDGTAQVVDLMFGRYVRNVPVSDAAFLTRSFQFEATYSNLANPGPGDEYEYSKGNYCNELTIDLPLTDKSTLSLGFIGTDTDVPTVTRKTGASTARQPSGTSALNTSSDIARLRIQQTDETGLTTDFKSVSLKLNNNVSPEKVLGTLGAKFMNTGNFEVDIESQLVFTSSGVVTAIRNNTPLQLDFIVKNADQAVAVDMPRLTLGDGSKEYPVNESILINTTAQAYGDPSAEVTHSLGVSFLPSVP